MMKKGLIVLLFAAGTIALFRIFDGYSFFEPLIHYVENGQIGSLVSPFSPEDIAERHLRFIGKKPDRQEVRFIPLLLFNVKFLTPDHETKEGRLLFNQVSGEAILSLEDYQESRGFNDLLMSRPGKEETALFFTLYKAGSKTLLEMMRKTEPPSQKTVEGLEKKGLIVKKGSGYKIHIKAPLFPERPLTLGEIAIVMRPYQYARLISKKFSEKEIRTLLENSFDEGFSIKSVKTLYLPIYVTEVHYPDGTESSFFWHGITGKRIEFFN